MSIVDRLIGRAVTALPSRRGPSLSGVDGDGLTIEENRATRRRDWQEVNRVVATSAPGLVGERALVVIEFSDGETLNISEADEHWSPLTEALKSKLGAPDETSWKFQLLVEKGQSLGIYQRR